jgi:hypothetical protein
MKPQLIRVVNKVHVNGFNEWMLKIKNIHYADNNQMCRAYDRVITANK